MRNSTDQKIIYSNFRILDERLKHSNDYNHIFIGNEDKQGSAWELFKRARRADAVILNIDPGRLLQLCTFCFLLPFRKFKLISVDILLRKPDSFKQKVIAFWKSLLLKQVDIFALYFKDTAGYEDTLGLRKLEFGMFPSK